VSDLWRMWDVAFPWGLLDSLGHTLRLPRRFQRPLCDRLERSLGVPEQQITTGSSVTPKITWRRHR